MTLRRIRQPRSYQEPNAEVIVTLCDSIWNHLHSKTVLHWVWHWLFSTHQVEHNQWPLLHPSSIPSLGMLCSLQDEQVPDLYHSCKCQGHFHNHLYLSRQVCTFIILPGSELHTKKNKQTTSHPEMSVLRCWGSLVMIMYKLTTNQLWWY